MAPSHTLMPAYISTMNIEIMSSHELVLPQHQQSHSQRTYNYRGSMYSVHRSTPPLLTTSCPLNYTRRLFDFIINSYVYVIPISSRYSVAHILDSGLHVGIYGYGCLSSNLKLAFNYNIGDWRSSFINVLPVQLT